MIALLLPLALAQELPEPPAPPPPPPAVAPAAPDTGYADELMRLGAWREAWVEYGRVAYALGSGNAADRARLQAGLALQRLETSLDPRLIGAPLPTTTAAYFNDAAALATPENAPVLRFLAAEGLYQTGSYAGARSALDSFTLPSLSAEQAYRLAWLDLRDGETEAARSAFAAVPGDGPLAQAGDRFAETLATEPPLPTRSPVAAGFMSAVVPGSGQLYAGEPQDAASAFVLNSALITGTALLARKRQWVGTATLGALALGFYTGNIFSAVNSSHRRNRRLERARLGSWEQDYELHVDVAPGATDDPLTLEATVGNP
ncbi:MAG: hypothetical protein H6739_20810 [Alphaproteobacteria bacterium]|nr:hypothetical protein [Alphaproteobacteria bacterium]